MSKSKNEKKNCNVESIYFFATPIIDTNTLTICLYFVYILNWILFIFFHRDESQSIFLKL